MKRRPVRVLPGGVLELYLKMPESRRPRPSLDRLIAVLDERPGLNRMQLVRALALSYAGTVSLLRRAESRGWVRGELEIRPGRRRTWSYRAVVPEWITAEGGASVTPPPGGGPRGPFVESRARSEPEE